MNHLYETYITSNIDFVVFIKEFTLSETRLDKLNEIDIELDLKNITKNEKLLIYLFIKKIFI